VDTAAGLGGLYLLRQGAEEKDMRDDTGHAVPTAFLVLP
jgi:hypothetical protein